MKKILKYFTIITAALLVSVSCDYDDTNFDMLTKAPDADATYFVQFTNASKSLETGVSVTGDLVDIETTIAVTLMGVPQSQDLVINFELDGASTINSSMYVMSANSITISAGQTSGSITIKSITEEMPVGETLDLILNIDAGEHNSPNENGTKLVYKMKRINFCPWSIDDMIGTYTGTDMDGYSGSTMSGAKFEVFKIDDTHIAISGFLQGLYSGIWGEAVSGGDRVILEYKSNGGFVSTNQYLCQTDDIWDYYFGPSNEAMKWDGCSETMTIPWYFHWDDGYGDNMGSLSVFTKD